MKTSRVIAGTMIALLLPWQAAAAEVDLYMRQYDRARHQAAVNVAEPAVRHFAAAAAWNKWGSTVRDVNHLLRYDLTEVCSAQCETAEGIGPCDADETGLITRPAISPDVCGSMAADITQIVSEEELIRAVGRKLQASVTANEVMLGERPDDPQNIAAHFAAIISVWAPGGTGDLNADLGDDEGRQHIRVVELKDMLDDAGDSELDARLDELNTALKNLVVQWPSVENDGESDEANPTIDERMVAAVWRYQFGVRLASDERAPRFPAPEPYADDDGEERQYVFMSRSDVEDALQGIWQLLPENPLQYSPALESEEVVIFTLEKEPLADFPGVTVWARMDGDAANNHPYGDAGLGWLLPDEPILPSLLTEEYLTCIDTCNGNSRCAEQCDDGSAAILGGTYPPEPVDEDGERMDGRGLCSQPFADDGYLCRPIEGGDSRDLCSEEATPQAGAIVLTSCTEECKDSERVFTFLGTTGFTEYEFRGSGRFRTETEFTIQGEVIAGGRRLPFWGSGQRAANGAASWQGEGVGAETSYSFQGTGVWGDSGVMNFNGESVVVTDGGSQTVPIVAASIQVSEQCEQTETGPDVCPEDWNGAPFDPRFECKVNVQCGGCGGGPFDTLALPKQSDGTINICVSNSLSEPATYLLLHELVHAKQSCFIPADTELPAPPTPDAERERCCRLEGEAYQVACKAMENDGVFLNQPPVGGIPVTAETCAEAMTDYQCNTTLELGHCPRTWDYPEDFHDALLASFSLNPANVPVSCAEAMAEETQDIRVTRALKTLERDQAVCAPGRTTEYRRSIGNNLCYVGQCIEEGFETHRVVGGRMTEIVSERRSPFMLEGATDIPGGLRFAPLSLSMGVLPTYMPEVLLDAMESSLCQSNGLPVLQPYTRCGFDARRAIYEGGGNPMAIAMSYYGQQRELAAAFGRQSMASAYGTRLGADFMAQYLSAAAAPFAGLIRSAAELLEQMNTVKFPVEMCPLGPET